MSTHEDIYEEMKRLLEAAREENLNLRLIGGLAIKFHSPSASHRALQRTYPDIDLVVQKRDKRKLEPFLTEMGYVPEKNFNLLNGDRRLLYNDAKNGRRIDVFVGDFEMCHKLPLRDRLDAQPVTVPLAELLLSKTQIIELNHKDALDIISLLLDNEIGHGDDGQINIDRILRLCLKDWGLYKTLTLTLNKVENILMENNPGLDARQQQVVLARINTIRRQLERVNKPILWQVRDRVGTRLRWYAEVEEVDR
ncbi:MAG TPA: nucleotidyltransferase family protein [Anaerolineales bacterium]|jgi:hypothetical protein